MYQLKSSERLIVIYVTFIIIKDLFTLYILSWSDSEVPLKETNTITAGESSYIESSLR